MKKTNTIHETTHHSDIQRSQVPNSLLRYIEELYLIPDVLVLKKGQSSSVLL